MKVSDSCVTAVYRICSTTDGWYSVLLLMERGLGIFSNLSFVLLIIKMTFFLVEIRVVDLCAFFVLIVFVYIYCSRYFVIILNKVAVGR